MDTLFRNGASFSSADYTDPRVFQSDLDLLASQWSFAVHISELPADGAFKVLQICGESIILVRTGADIRGYHNICRHRGSRICTTAEGTAERFVCPYHGWTYGLDGQLTRASGIVMRAEQLRDFGLEPVGVVVYEGLVFVALTPHLACDFSGLEEILAPAVGWHGLARAKVACRRSYPTRANWKLVVENFLECFHCFPNHPELCSVYSHPKLSGSLDPALAEQFLSEAAEWERAARNLGHPTGGVTSIDPAAKQFCVAFRMPIQRGFWSTSEDGAPQAPLMGRFSQYDGGETFGLVGPLLHFSLANDHAMLIRIDPLDAVNTAIELTWLVDADATEGTDFDCDKLAWLWDATVKQDRALVERAQSGAKSRFYVPGPYTALELESARFAAWYRARSEAGSVI